MVSMVSDLTAVEAPAALADVGEPSKVSVTPTIASAPSVAQLAARKQSATMLSGPGAGAGEPQCTGTFASSCMIYVTSCFGCSCLAMPWVSKAN